MSIIEKALEKLETAPQHKPKPSVSVEPSDIQGETAAQPEREEGTLEASTMAPVQGGQRDASSGTASAESPVVAFQPPAEDAVAAGLKAGAQLREDDANARWIEPGASRANEGMVAKVGPPEPASLPAPHLRDAAAVVTEEISAGTGAGEDSAQPAGVALGAGGDGGGGEEAGESTRNYADLDYAGLAAAGVITPDTAQSSVAEQIRIIKRPLLAKASLSGSQAVPRGNLIQVTSALPSEGKTFSSVNLAISMAMELDRTVLLVDGDTARSDVARILGIDQQEGLSDYLIKREKPLSEYLVRTDMPTLTVLPAGRHYPNMTEVFGSEDMQSMMDELASRYSDRIVIIDSAPLLATSGSTVIAHLVGQIVLVVEAIRTPQSAIRDALEMLEGISHDNVGIILNKSRDRMVGGYRYGYGYGYYFGGKG